MNNIIIAFTFCITSFLSCKEENTELLEEHENNPVAVEEYIELTGEYHGICQEIKSGLDTSTGLIFNDTTEYEKTITIINAWKDSIYVEGAFWNKYRGSNEETEDTLHYIGQGTQHIFYDIFVMRSAKELVYRYSYINQGGPGGKSEKCFCKKE